MNKQVLAKELTNYVLYTKTTGLDESYVRDLASYQQELVAGLN